ncbi:MAG TPA: hypothetical protein VGF67_26960 [Ktedonobacteraceae bacterium]|jgi:hypothetical protein
MSKKRIAIIALAPFLCLMILGVLPASARGITPSTVSQGASRTLSLYPAALTIHTPASRLVSSQAAVGGGCANYVAAADPVLFQACISIGGGSVIPDAYVTSDSSASWTGCTIEIGMYVSTDGTHFTLESNDPTQANCLAYLRSGQWGHFVGHTRPAQTIHEYFNRVTVIVTTTQHRAVYQGDSPVQYCC